MAGLDLREGTPEQSDRVDVGKLSGMQEVKDLPRRLRRSSAPKRHVLQGAQGNPRSGSDHVVQE